MKFVAIAIFTLLAMSSLTAACPVCDWCQKGINDMGKYMEANEEKASEITKALCSRCYKSASCYDSLFGYYKRVTHDMTNQTAILGFCQNVHACPRAGEESQVALKDDNCNVCKTLQQSLGLMLAFGKPAVEKVCEHIVQAEFSSRCTDILFFIVSKLDSTVISSDFCTQFGFCP